MRMDKRPYKEEFRYEGGIVDFVKYINVGIRCISGLSKTIYF
jgi:hypothetical protein